jgi:hypothetical protein
MIRFLLLHRIEWTDANQWFSIAGLIVTGVLGALVNGWLR